MRAQLTRLAKSLLLEVFGHLWNGVPDCPVCEAGRRQIKDYGRPKLPWWLRRRCVNVIVQLWPIMPRRVKVWAVFNDE